MSVLVIVGPKMYAGRVACCFGVKVTMPTVYSLQSLLTRYPVKFCSSSLTDSGKMAF